MSKARRQGNQLVLPDLAQLQVPQPDEPGSNRRNQISVDQPPTGRPRRPRTGYSPGGTERARRVSSVQAPSANVVEETPRRRRISAYEMRARRQTEDDAGRSSALTARTPTIKVEPPPAPAPLLTARRRLSGGQRSRPSTAAVTLAVEPQERPRAWSMGSLGRGKAAAAPDPARRRSSGTGSVDVLSGLDRRLPLIVDPQLSDAAIRRFHSALMSNAASTEDLDVVETSDDESTWSELWRLESNGEKPGQIHAVRGVCFAPGGRVAVTEDRNGRVQLFDCRLTRRSCGVLQPGGRKRARRRFQPGGVCAIPSDAQAAPVGAWLAVTDVDRVLLFDEDSGRVDELNVQERAGLFGVALTGRGRLVLTDAGDRPTVALHDFTSGQLVNEFDLNVEFQKPLHVAVNVDFSVTCVSDSEQRCVFLFDRDGRILLNTVTGEARPSYPECRQFTYPAGICCVDDGRSLLVVDSVENCIYSYDFRNRQLLPLLTAMDHGLRHPSCIAVDDSGGLLAVVEEFDDVMIDHCQLKMFTRRRR